MLKSALQPLMLCLFAAPAFGEPGQECGSRSIPIAAIQGTGDQSPMKGKTVTVEGVITLDARSPDGFQGFYLQQADHETDDDPATSEALFVYTRSDIGARGQRVRVTGQVKEFHGLTELTRVSGILPCGSASLPEPVSITVPWTGENRPEHYENMRVRIQDRMTVVDHYNLTRFGELTLAADDQWIPTQQHPPGDRARQLFGRQQASRVTLDDGQGSRNPRTIPWLNDGFLPRAGDRVGNLEGVLDFRFDRWRIQPGTMPEFQRSNPRPPTPDQPDASHLRVMALNLGNYFNGNGNGDGFLKNRGARNQEAFRQQTQKLAAALTAPDPDIIAVMELENDGHGPDSSLSQLVSALGDKWRAVGPTGRKGGQAIRNALLYRSDRVSPLGEPDQHPTGNGRGRPTLSQRFQPLGSEHHLRVMVPHLKSKACRGASGADRDQGDGQGCYAATRTRDAKALVRRASELPQPDGFIGTLITGDFNSYPMEAPMQALKGSGFTDLVRQQGDADSYYTFRYKGRRGALDTSLACERLTPRVRSAFIWPINADEPRALSYDGDRADGDTDHWRSSDHDPVITDIAI